MADSMEMLIAGRALQGCGAIAGVALAFAADHTRVQNRSVIMAVIGLGIGASFLLSMMVSVPLSSLLGLTGLFWLTAVLGVMGMLLVLSLPAVRVSEAEVLQQSGHSATVWPFAVSVCLLHAVMTLLFVVLPGMLVTQFGFELEYHWRIYVPSVLGSVVFVFPLLRRIASKKQENSALPLAFLTLGAALGLMSLGWSLASMMLCALVFFLAFNLLEAAMPSMVSQLTGSTGRGQKMGLYTTFQFLGAFLGGLGGGWLLGFGGDVLTLSVAGSFCALWAVVMLLWLRPIENGQQT
jgi:MFS family permease